MLKELILKNRSYRRFYQDFQISKGALKELVDLARLCPSAANLQILRFMLINSKEESEKVFSCLGWAGYLKDWDGPKQGEKPSAFIVILSNRPDWAYIKSDVGIVSQSILLGAVEMGLGGCMFGSVQKDKLRKSFSIPEEYEIQLVIALGKPKEKIVIEEVKGDDIKYWRDENDVHHVPKRKLEDLIL